jgi:chemotaxis protein CheX
MDVGYVNPFIVSTIETFKIMLHTEVKPGQPIAQRDDNLTNDISGIIGLSGSAQGAISLSFPKTVALKAVSAFVGYEIKIVGLEVTDGIGEIVNIIAGNAKRNMTQLKIAISLPNVVIGKSHTLSAPSGSANIVVPFSSALGDFSMKISLRTNT